MHLSLTFLYFLPTHKNPTKQLHRLGHAASTECGFGFIAPTFTVLFALCQPAVWQRLPLYQGDIFGLFFFFSKLWGCKRATWQISFPLYPQQSWLYCPDEAVLFGRRFLWGLKKKKTEKKKESWLYVTLNQHNARQCFLFFLLLLSSFHFDVLACSTFPVFIDFLSQWPTHNGGFI